MNFICLKALSDIGLENYFDTVTLQYCYYQTEEEYYHVDGKN